MKSQSACHFCSWKKYCFPSKTALVQDCFGSSWNTKPLSVALSILLVSSKCVLTTMTTAKNKCSHPPAHVNQFLYSESSLFTTKRLHQKKEMQKKCVEISATSRKKLCLSRRFTCEPPSHKGKLLLWRLHLLIAIPLQYQSMPQKWPEGSIPVFFLLYINLKCFFFNIISSHALIFSFIHLTSTIFF